MSSLSLADSTLLGANTRHRGVKIADTQPRPWLQGMTECAVLAEQNIVHLGVVEAFAPYRFVRSHLTGPTFLACLGGEGRVYVNGQWASCRAGSAILLQSHAATAYYAVDPGPWTLVWIYYRGTDGRSPVATVSAPALCDYDPQPLFHAIEGLRAECLANADPLVQRSFVNLIHQLVLRYAAPWRREDRLQPVWEKVATELGADWTLDRLAGEARCSGEQLRRLCRRQLGRSPMQHLTHLRLQRATELLLASHDKVEYIAAQVGYHDAFAFSATFKKWIGCPPSEYRLRRIPLVAKP